MSIEIPIIEEINPNQEVVVCDNPEFPEDWFYEVVDEEVYRHHSSKAYEPDQLQTDKQMTTSVTSNNTTTEVKRIEDLPEEKRSKTITKS